MDTALELPTPSFPACTAEEMTPAVGEDIVVNMTMTVGPRVFELEFSWNHKGIWRIEGLRALEAAVGREVVSDWLIRLWHHTDLGKHVWNLGNPPLRW